MLRLDRRSSIPLYHQLKEKLIQRIESGDLKVGALLPTEMDLVDRYAVSRTTVRQAMQALGYDGYISRTPGKGTFVIRTKLSRGLTRLTSFSEDMQARGESVASKLLEFKQIEADEVLAEKFNLPVGTQLIYASRLRSANGIPVALNISYIHLPEGFAVTQEELEETGSIFSLFDQKQVPPLEADRTIEAVAATEEWARLLHIPIGSPILLVEGLVYTYDRHPIEFHKVISVGDRYKYAVHLER
ncbi:MAG: GntR family transcriptional regulator [Anaerolineaceae bacterium]|nr:GntR family transcriptional regulator [Anaerolineaceae bacterium]